MAKYRVEQNRNRQESFDGAKPLQTVGCDSRKEAVEEMKRLAAGGQFYAAVFIGRDGEMVEETDDVKS
jgi:hypothetical protein